MFPMQKEYLADKVTVCHLIDISGSITICIILYKLPGECIYNQNIEDMK